MELGFFKLTLRTARQWTRSAPAARSPHRVALLCHAVWSARLHAGESVRCERGLVWLTQSGDARDYFLRAGESFTARRRGKVVAQACEYSQLRVEEKR